MRVVWRGVRGTAQVSPFQADDLFGPRVTKVPKFFSIGATNPRNPVQCLYLAEHRAQFYASSSKINGSNPSPPTRRTFNEEDFFCSLSVQVLAFAAPLFASVGEHLIPAGSLIQCTIAEPRISSKTTAVGDPVLCQVGHAERYGRSVLPHDSYLVGRFEDYKDPGHFVGKGWMELKFDRMVIEPDTVIPVDARVVDVPGYKVDNQGRILGKGHETRDIVDLVDSDSVAHRPADAAHARTPAHAEGRDAADAESDGRSGGARDGTDAA